MQPLFSDTGAVVIVYFPDENVLGNVKSYASHFKEVLVIDNSPFPSAALKALANENYWHNGHNEGIAKRLNEACYWAKAKGYNWVLTMDQDSAFTQSNLIAYHSAFEKLKMEPDLAMVGILYSPELNDPILLSLKRDTVLITSGSLVNIGVFEKVGGFNEAYFIDEVDSEYCLRAIKMGYKTILVEGVYLFHHLGESNNFISLKSFKSTPRSLHNPVRIYYMIRNYFDLKSRYRSAFPEHFEQQDRNLMNRIKNNILYNRKRIKVLKMIWKGYSDFKAQRFGKLA